MDMYSLLLIGAATSADIFAAAVGIGASGIKLPMRSSLAAVVTGAAVLWAASSLSGAAAAFISAPAAVLAARMILAVMGLREIFGDSIKKLFSSRKETLSFRLISDGASADSDLSRSISVREALVMGFALSADSAVSGLGAGLGGMRGVWVFLVSLVWGFVSVRAGYHTGIKISARTGGKRVPAGAVSGIILILLAFLM
ncbi:MAG: hypothetical protein ACI4KF_10810 [Huintestinicola sp.]